ncbi:MAG: hypothetical protein R2748_19625 [Bryobacterales bacterium]
MAYLQSDFILKYVQEFQSPNFSNGFMKPLEATILFTLLVCGRMVWRGGSRLAVAHFWHGRTRR